MHLLSTGSVCNKLKKNNGEEKKTICTEFLNDMIL